MTDIVVYKTAETATTVTLEWLPVAGAHGYVFLYGNGRSSSTLDGSRTTLKIAKVNLPVEVRAGRTLASGVYPPSVTPGYAAPAWLVTEQLNQTDPNSGVNHYTAGWAKSARVAPGYPADWQDEGYLRFADYPDELVLVCSKQFVQGCPGVTTNFHLTGDDPVPSHNGVSPILGQWHEGQPYEICCKAEGDGSENQELWPIAQANEIDRSAVYTEQWHVRWRTDRTGYIHLAVLKNGQAWKQVNVDRIRTQYVEQKPQAFIWVGGYESEGLRTVAKVRTTLDHRGRTLAEALADRPKYGSIMHTVSTAGGPDSSVVADGTLAVG